MDVDREMQFNLMQCNVGCEHCRMLSFFSMPFHSFWSFCCVFSRSVYPISCVCVCMGRCKMMFKSEQFMPIEISSISYYSYTDCLCISIYTHTHTHPCDMCLSFKKKKRNVALTNSVLLKESSVAHISNSKTHHHRCRCSRQFFSTKWMQCTAYGK